MDNLCASITPACLSDHLRDVELPVRKGGVLSAEAERILRRGRIVGSAIHHFSSLERTMVQARSHIRDLERQKQSVRSGTVFIARELTGSKGRFRRYWHAPPGGLWGSMIHVNTLLPSSRLLVPLAVGVACCEAIRETGAAEAKIRWINDVLLSGKKVAGFLLEGFFGEISREEFTIAGFGINVNNTGFPDELHAIATSLREHLGQTVDLPRFTCTFLAKLCWNFGLLEFEEERFLKDEHWSGPDGSHALLAQWLELSDSVGRRVKFGFDVLDGSSVEAVVSGISENGGLILKLDDGSELVEHSGEIRYCD